MALATVDFSCRLCVLYKTALSDLEYVFSSHVSSPVVLKNRA